MFCVKSELRLQFGPLWISRGHPGLVLGPLRRLCFISALHVEQKKEVLVVASKLKAYIREASGMNTSGAVIEKLSDKIRGLCDQAIERAKSEGRKTVMDRDFE